jgi:hypothetical protein
VLKSQDRSAIVDEFGELDRRVAEFKPQLKRYEALKAQIRTWAEKIPAADSVEYAGTRYTAQLGPREMKRTVIDKLKAFTILKKVLGLKGALAVVTIPLEKAVDAHIPEAQHKLIVKEERTGSRDITAVAKAVPAKAA